MVTMPASDQASGKAEKISQPLIVETLRAEEERFRRTLGRGMALLDEATVGLNEGDVLSGEMAFKLYDTYGFPLDLTQDAVRAKGLSVDLDSFAVAMERQRAQGRENWSGSGQAAQGAGWLAVRDRLGPTAFKGYDSTFANGELLAIGHDGAQADSAAAGDTVELLFDATPYYAESGGQAGDTGLIEWDGGTAQVLDTKKEAGDLHVHVAKIIGGSIKLGQRATLSVDASRRLATRSNHSAAHLVHAALAHVLGAHVAQKGQLVDGERMRFDFSHSGPLTADELDRVEAEVNAVIRQNFPADTQEMAPEEAMKAGAIALFGEKYGASVRVLALGHALTGEDKAYSVELCGGTHVGRTGDIALFKIVAETGIAAGVRRVEALTGEAARRYLLDQAAVAKDLAERFKAQVAEVPARVEALDAARRSLEKQLADAKRQLALGGGTGGSNEPEDIGGIKLIARVLDGVDGKGLRPVVEDFRKQVGSGVVALIGVTDGKAAVAVAVTDDLTGRLNAVDLARAAVLAMGGQGAGGKADFAQGGAPEGSKGLEGLAALKVALQ